MATILKPSEVNWQEYRELRLSALKTEPQAFLTTYEKASKESGEKWQGYLQAAVDGESWMVFASEDGKLVGMIGAYQSEEGKKKNEAEVIAVYVEPENRGRKISKQLLEALLSILKESGMKSAHLECNIDQVPAIALYSNLGFEEVGRRKLVLGDGKEHELVAMRRVL